jgi:hypothetical protein
LGSGILQGLLLAYGARRLTNNFTLPALTIAQIYKQRWQVELFKWIQHTLLDLRGNTPAFVHITDGKVHDVNVLDQIVPEAGAFYVM